MNNDRKEYLKDIGETWVHVDCLTRYEAYEDAIAYIEELEAQLSEVKGKLADQGPKYDIGSDMTREVLSDMVYDVERMIGIFNHNTLPLISKALMSNNFKTDWFIKLRDAIVFRLM